MKDADDLKKPNLDEAVIKEQFRKEATANAMTNIFSIDGLPILKAELDYMLENAKNRVRIMSGWASSFVFEVSCVRRFIRLLENGAEINIGFGYDLSADKRTPD